MGLVAEQGAGRWEQESWQEGARASSSRPGNTGAGAKLHSGVSAAMTKDDGEATSLPGDVAAAPGTEGSLCSWRSFEAQLRTCWPVSAQGSRACPRLSPHRANRDGALDSGHMSHSRPRQGGKSYGKAPAVC